MQIKSLNYLTVKYKEISFPALNVFITSLFNGLCKTFLSCIIYSVVMLSMLKHAFYSILKCIIF